MARHTWLIALCLLLLPFAVTASEAATLVQQAIQRHFSAPFGYQRLQLVMTDASGNHRLRQVRRYWRADSVLKLNQLLVVDFPPELRGVALLARQRGAEVTSGVYLPAHGQRLIRSGDTGESQRLPGTDLQLGDLVPEYKDNLVYTKSPSRVIQGVGYWVLEARPVVARPGGIARQVHYIRKDNTFIERTDFLGENGKLLRRRQYLGIRPASGDTWLADSLLLEDRQSQQNTLVIVDDRAYSENYVPKTLFEPATLFAGRHLQSPELWLPTSDDAGSKEGG